MNLRANIEVELDGTVCLNYAQELPVFPFPGRRRPGPHGMLFHREISIPYYAEKMARGNARCFGVESGDPISAYEDFLRELVIIPGLEAILESYRYRLVMGIGSLHHPDDVGAQVACLVQQSFYESHTLQFEVAPKRKARPAF